MRGCERKMREREEKGMREREMRKREGKEMRERG